MTRRFSVPLCLRGGFSFVSSKTSPHPFCNLPSALQSHSSPPPPAAPLRMTWNPCCKEVVWRASRLKPPSLPASLRNFGLPQKTVHPQTRDAQVPIHAHAQQKPSHRSPPVQTQLSLR